MTKTPANAVAVMSLISILMVVYPARAEDAIPGELVVPVSASPIDSDKTIDPPSCEQQLNFAIFMRELKRTDGDVNPELDKVDCTVVDRYAAVTHEAD